MSKEEKEKAPAVSSEKEVDLSNTGRGVWLVKVPKYIEKYWFKAPSNMDVGKLTIVRVPGQKAKVSLSLTEDVINLEADEHIPRKHVLDVSVVTKQTLGVFSHLMPSESVGSSGTSTSTNSSSSSNATTKDKEKESNSSNPTANGDESEKIFMEGRIVQKLECRPVADETYMKLKLASIRKASIPQRRVRPLDKIVHNFKPVKDHAHNIEYRERKKAEGKKARDDKNYVMDILFNAFEKHQYYNIKDLVTITKQPIGYLKEILKEVCDYNVKNPHKNMWELKKEYRHYKTEEEKKVNEEGIQNAESE